MSFDIEKFAEAWRWHNQAGGDDPSRRAAGEVMLSMMAEDVHYDEAMLHLSWHGLDEVQEMLKNAVNWSQDHYHTVVSAHAIDGTYFIEWTMKGKGNIAGGLVEAHDNDYHFRGVSVGRYNQDGLVYYHADYWDILNWFEMSGTFLDGKQSWFMSSDEMLGF